MRALLPIAAFALAGYAQPAPKPMPVHVTVMAEGGFVRGLPPESFTILEGGKPQTIRDFDPDIWPLSIGLVVDDSGSMRDSLPVTREALSRFLGGLHPEDEVSLTLFGDIPVLAQDFTTDRTAIMRAFEQGKRYGPSAVLDAADFALQHLLYRGRNSKRVLVFVTDGLDNASLAKSDGVTRALSDSGVLLYAIGLLPARYTRVEQAGKDTMNNFARATGGAVFFTNNPKDLINAAAGIASEVHREYLLTYLPANPKADGKFRKIEVKVKLPTGDTPKVKNLRVRSRSGYYSSK